MCSHSCNEKCALCTNLFWGLITDLVTCKCTYSDIVETHGYGQEYQWVHAPAFEPGNVATVGLFRTFRLRRHSSAEYLVIQLMKTVVAEAL